MLKKNDKGNSEDIVPIRVDLTEAKDINLEFNNNKKTGDIGYVTSGKNFSIINSVMNSTLFRDSTIKFLPFESEQAMETFYLNNRNSLLAGIVFDSDIMSYTIRIDGSLIPDPSAATKDINNLLENDNTTNYLSVFSPLQVAIDHAIIQMKTGDSSINLNTKIGKLPRIYSEERTEVSKIDTFSIFLMSMLFILPLLPVVRLIVSEKERKIKSFLLTVGMHPSSFWISWFISNAIYLTIMAIVMGFILAIFRVFSISIVLTFTVVNCLYAISLINFTLLFTSLFNNSKTAYSIAEIIFILFTLTYIVFSWGSRIVKYVASVFFSPVSYGTIVERLIFYEKSSTFSFLGFITDKLVYVPLSLLVWDIVFYFVLALIFDCHFSEENESFMTWKKKYRSRRQTYEGIRNSPYIDDMEERFGFETNHFDIRNVSKEFKSYGKKILALNDVSFKAYQDEIFCILGHNGAGKSTLIKILTGRITPNEGLILFEENNFYSNRKFIRERMGKYIYIYIIHFYILISLKNNIFKNKK